MGRLEQLGHDRLRELAWFNVTFLKTVPLEQVRDTFKMSTWLDILSAMGGVTLAMLSPWCCCSNKGNRGAPWRPAS